MKHLALTVGAVLVATFSHAQIYQWKDANGKTVISDKPPTGNVRDEKKIEGKSSPPGATPQKTLADREMDYRKRQQATQEHAEKTKKEESAAAEKKDSCERVRRNLELLESGERVAVRDDKGERSFMDDEQRGREIAKARQTIQSTCK